MNPTSAKKFLLRGFVVAGAALLVAFGPGQASAAETPSGAPDAHDLAAISGVVTGQGTLDRLATTSFPGARKVGAAAAAQTASTDATTPIAVYEPTAAFVAGKSSVPAELAYVAVPAKTGDGSTATVWTEREGAAWSVFNVASGDFEKRYAAEAGKGYLLHEPQVNAWYAVDGDTVTVLDGSVTGLAKGTKVTVEAYRAALHSRYADKLPGSAYDRSGAGGGYSPAAVPADSPASTLPFLLGGGALVLVAGGGLALRARRQ